MKGGNEMEYPECLSNHRHKERIIAIMVEKIELLKKALCGIESVAYCRQRHEELDREIYSLFDEPYSEEIRELAAQYKKQSGG